METTTFDGITRSLSSTLTRRSALRSLFAGALTVVAGGAVLPSEETSAKKRKKKGDKLAPPPPPPPPAPPANVCAGKN